MNKTSTMLIKATIVLFLVFYNLQSRGQALDQPKEIRVEDYVICHDSLCQQGLNKVIIPSFEVASLIALSHYPELKNTRIIFVRKSIKTTAACRPTFSALFHSRKNRTYKIYINNDSKKINGAMLEGIPFDAQIGLIGHELGHVVDYSRMSLAKIISTGFQYLFVSGKSRIEKRVDSITIAHRLGWQLYRFDDFIFNHAAVSQTYKAYKGKIYYKPEDLLLLLGKR